MIDKVKYKLTAPKMIPPKPSDTKYKTGNLDAPHGWLNTKGEFFPCKYGDHDWVAEFTHLDDGEYSEAMRDPSGGPHGWSTTATQVLERKGWIKIQKYDPWIPGHMSIDDECLVTKDQFRFLNDYLANHNVIDIGAMCLRIK